jgi:hypothetical protein
LEAFKLQHDLGICRFLVKNALTSHLAQIGRRPIGFNPIELVSIKAEDNLIAFVFGADYPFQICAKYTIDTRIVRERACLVIDCATRKVVTQNCEYFLNKGST